MVATGRMNDIFEDDRQLQNKGKDAGPRRRPGYRGEGPGGVTKPTTSAMEMTKATDEQTSPPAHLTKC